MIRYASNPSKVIAAAAPRCVRSLEERMASDLRELAFAGQNADTAALIARGWTVPTIKRLAPRATEIARRMSVSHIVRA